MELRATPAISLPTRFVRAITAVVVVSGAGAVLVASGDRGLPAKNHEPSLQSASFAVGERSAFARNRFGVDPWTSTDRAGRVRLADHTGARWAALTSITNRSDFAVVVTRVTRADDELRLVGFHLRSFSPTLPGRRSVLPVGYPSTFVPQRLSAGATVWLQLDYQTVGCPSAVHGGAVVQPGRRVVLFYRARGTAFSAPIDVPGMPIVCGS